MTIALRTFIASRPGKPYDFIGELVKGGAYENSSEVVEAALRLLREEELRRAPPARFEARQVSDGKTELATYRLA